METIIMGQIGTTHPVIVTMRDNCKHIRGSGVTGVCSYNVVTAFPKAVRCRDLEAKATIHS